MKTSQLVAAILVAGLLGFAAPRPVLAQSAAPAAIAAPADADAGLSDGEKAAAGCGVAAAGGMAASYIAGPSEIAMLWGGGMLVPSGSIMLALTLLGQIGASACAIGVLATPTVLWAYDQSGNIAARVVEVSQGVGASVLAAFGQGPAPEAAAH